MPRFWPNTLRMPRGEKTRRMPFWKVGVGMSALARRLAEDKRDCAAEVNVAQRRGWDAVRVGWVRIYPPGGPEDRLQMPGPDDLAPPPDQRNRTGLTLLPAGL